MDISLNSAFNGYSSSSYQTGFSSTPVNQNQGTVSKTEEFSDPQVRAAKRAGKIECETCKNRKYQDGSNDPGVSFKTAGHIDPASSASVVMSHEQEHVSNEKAKASAENRRVVSQSVKLETSVCPECGRTYVSGGETRTVTKSDSSKDKKDYFIDMFNKTLAKNFGKNVDVKV